MIQVQACDKIGFGETMANFPGQQVNGSLTSPVLRADLGEDFANDLCDPILRQLRGSSPTKLSFSGRWDPRSRMTAAH